MGDNYFHVFHGAWEGLSGPVGTVLGSYDLE